MENNEFAIAYRPGCFGKFLDTIIKIQSGLSPNINSNSPHSHDEFDSVEDNIKYFHKQNFTHEDELIFAKYKTIFPYFPQTHRFLGTYMNYLKFYNGLPQVNAFEKFNIKTIAEAEQKGLLAREVYYKAVVTHFWLESVVVPTNVLPLNMLSLFTNLKLFIANLEELLEQKLSQQSLDFISIKQKTNLPIFNEYEQAMAHTSREDLLVCFRVVMHIDYDVAKYSLFLNNPTQFIRTLTIEDK